MCVIIKMAQNNSKVTLRCIPALTSWTHHVSPVQPAEYISMSRGPMGLHSDWHWGQGSRGHPSGAGSESAFCCTAERWAPMWCRTPVCCNYRGGGAPEEGLALRPWAALSCPPPGPWCTLAGWHSHEPGEDHVNLSYIWRFNQTQSWKQQCKTKESCYATVVSMA